MTKEPESNGSPPDGSRSASDLDPRGVSPYSTGGGGFTLERRVAVLYLAKLLTGETSGELEGRRVTRVAFQQAPAKPVDDIVIYAARDGEVQPSLELDVAVRRAPDFVTSDSKTAELLAKALRALRDAAPLGTGVDRLFAICVAGDQNAARQVRELALSAKNHQADSFFVLLRTRGKFGKEVRERLDHFVNLVKTGLAALGEEKSVSAAETAAFALLSRLHVLMPRVESPDESDWNELLNKLEKWSREQTLTGAAGLRDRLESLAASYAPNAAVVELPKLRRDVHDVLNSNRHRNDRCWAELMRLDKDARESVTTEMGRGATGGLHLPRTAAATALRNRFGEGPCVLVHGESGVGKSALVLSELSVDVEDDSEKPQVVFLNLRLLPRTISELRQALGCAVEDVLCEMSAPRLLVIDSAESFAESNPDVLRHLVHAATASDVVVWVITTTEGKDGVRAVVETILSPIAEHEISALDDQDLEKMAEAFPQLHNLVADPRSKELLRRPVVADLLVRARSSQRPLNDADVLAIVWEKLVRADGRTDRGKPDSRDQVFRRLANHQLQPGSASDLYTALDATVLDGLRRDGLLRSSTATPWQVLPEFSHDLLRTFAVAQVLLADGEPVTALLEVGAPRWALPAARLAAQVLLAAPETVQKPMVGRLDSIQIDYDRLAAAGHGQRWSDLPIEAVLPLPKAGSALGGAWTQLLAADARGLRRVLRLIRQRPQRQGLADPLVAEPIIELLLRRAWPKKLEVEVEKLLCNWLRALIVAKEPAGHSLRLKLRRRIVRSVEEGDGQLAELEAKQAAALAARTLEQVREDGEREQRRRERKRRGFREPSRPPDWLRPPRELIHESTMENLSLLGPDLGEDGEALLRRVVRDAPPCLAPAVERPLTGEAIASYRPSLLTELVDAYYYLGDDGGTGWNPFYDGIRSHHPRSSGSFGPLAASYRGPFLAMFQTDFRNGARVLNRLLNHAAKVRAEALQDNPSSSHDPSDEKAYRTVLLITGKPRAYIGDSHVWLWYRGSGVGPYPCMSALQALEVVCDQFIEAGIPPGQLASVLLDDCDNLAMPALVVGLLVRHLEVAGDALDPFFTEPVIWRLEFQRVSKEDLGLAASSQGIHAPERRKWSLRETATALVLSSDGERIDSLRELGERLKTRARELEADEIRVSPGKMEKPALSEGLAEVHAWATALDCNSYQVTRHESGLRIQHTIADEVQQVLEPSNQELSRWSQGTNLLTKYAVSNDHSTRLPNVSLSELQSDLATSRELLANPPASSVAGSLAAPAGVAAGALQLYFIAGEQVPDEELVWSAQVLVEIVTLYASADRSEYEFSFHSRGADRAAARGIPFVFLPEATTLRAKLDASGITQADLTEAARWLTSGSPHEVRQLYAQTLDLVWRAPCDDEKPVACHHGRAFELLEDAARVCIIGDWEPKTGQCRINRLDGPLERALASATDERIMVPRLSAAIRGFSVAANTPNCCRDRAEELLAALLKAHRQGMAGYEQGYTHSESDALVAGRALLVEVANGKEGLLQAHVEDYVVDARLLSELLPALAAAAEESRVAAQAARRVWPKIIDQVLDLIDAGYRGTGDGYFTSASLAALMPNRTHTASYLWRELESEPIDWTDVLAWRKQVERWLPVAAGNYECVDSLIGLLGSLKEDDQAEPGLPWIETLVQGGPEGIASRSWLLPDWLREMRLHIRSGGQLSCWQRIVDMLVVAGDTRVAGLSD